MGDIYRAGQRLLISMLSGKTQSTVVGIKGIAMGHVILPGGFKGNAFFRAKNARTSSVEAKVYDDTVTAIGQSVVGFTKPLSMAIRPEVFAVPLFRICSTSAQTANKTLDFFGKG